MLNVGSASNYLPAQDPAHKIANFIASAGSITERSMNQKKCSVDKMSPLIASSTS